MNKQLLKGNEAAVYGALLGGATHFFGYPITPASEVSHAAARLFPRAGRHFLQAESEVNAINMLYGAAAAGARVMTASSGPGVSLMTEGLSYMAATELPCVVVDIQRAGPGLGSIWPEQADYFQVVKGGGHGSYRNIVFAAGSAQEMLDFSYRAFDVADQYRMTVFVLADAYIGQMMEPVQLPATVRRGKRKEWALYADQETRGNLITSIMMNSDQLSSLNWRLKERYDGLEDFAEAEEVGTEDAEYLLIAYGISARICLTALRNLRRLGIPIGLFRPQTLFPFPSARLEELSHQLETCMVVELSNGQMAEDIERIIGNEVEVLRYNWMGGVVPAPAEVEERVKEDIGFHGE